MAIQMNRGNPAITGFQRQVQLENEGRRAEEGEFRQRAAFERGIQGDTAVRRAIGEFYSAPQQGSEVVPVFADAGGMSVTATPTKAQQPVFDPASGAGEFGAEPPIAAAPQAAAPAAAPVSAVQNRPSRMAPVMASLAKTPGTGGTMMNLFTRDVADQRTAATEERRLKIEGSKQMLAHLKEGDARGARAVAQQYGINMPEEFWTNRGALMNARTAANLAKTLSISDDYTVQFTYGYMEAMSRGAREDQAMLAGLKRVPTDGFKVKGHITGEDNQVHFYDEGGRIRPAGIKARPTARGAGAGGAASATIANRDDMARRIKVAYPGLPEDVVQRLVINPRASITPQDVIKTRNAMQKLQDALGRPLYKTTQELDNAVKQVIAGAKEMAGFASPAPAPPGPPAPAAAPGLPGKKRLRFNSQTQQLEEVPG